MPRPARSRAILHCALATALAVAIGVQPARAGFGRDAFSPVVVAPTANSAQFGGACSDGSGGMLVAWSDFRAGTMDIYVQRYTGTGSIAAGWPANGLLVCGASGSQTGAQLLGDGAGGAIVAWTDARGLHSAIYATRVLGNGTIAPGWPTNGLLASTGGLAPSYDNGYPVLTSDGAGGAFIIWQLTYTVTDYDVYGAHVTAAGALAWSLAVYAPTGSQNAAQITTDGAGGFYVAFEDNEGGSPYRAKVMRLNGAGSTVWGPSYVGVPGTAGKTNVCLAPDLTGGVYAVCDDYSFVSFSNITANHYLASGADDPTWGGPRLIAFENGLNQNDPLALADGSGGLLTAFTDVRNGTSDLFLQRTGPYALAYPGWPDIGIPVAVALGRQTPVSMVADGTGGAIIAFQDNRLGFDSFLYATRALGNGLLAPGWSFGGNLVEQAGLLNVPGNYPAAVSDGKGDALFAWADTRGLSSPGYGGVFAQNLDGFGTLGDARPSITRIADVPNDQGGKVSLQWTASYLDANPARTVMQYTVWRRVPGGTAAAAAAHVARATAAHPAWRTTIEGAQVVYWEYVATEPALMLPGYSAVVPTTSDSMPAGNPRTSLMVVAESADLSTFWQSPADSGYSVDNLPPLPPAPFTGTYAAGAASLSWGANAEPDLAGYRLYRGTSAAFVPAPANLVVALSSTTYHDPAGAPYYYRLTAIDIHGNESASTLLLPGGALAVEGAALPRELALAAPMPNPARGRATLRYALPRDANVRLALYDVSGRRVRTLVDGAMPAGEHAAAWDLSDDGGHSVGAGLYFARFEAEGHTFVQRVMALR